MVSTIAVTEAITDLNQAHRQFNLSRTLDPAFFSEWRADLPVLTETEKVALDRYRDRYLDYSAEGAISEGTINVIMVAPLLELLGLCDSPYRIRGERYVQITIENEDTVLNGRIDVLVVQNQFWIALVEAKHFGFSVSQAIPQTLAYMMACLNPQTSIFAMITTGEDYTFIKLDRREKPIYTLSYKFTLLSDENNNLHRVAQVIKRIARVLV